MLPVVFDFKYHFESSIIYHAEFQQPDQYRLTWYSPTDQCHKSTTYDLCTVEHFVFEGTWVITSQADVSCPEDDIDFEMSSIL